MKSVWSMERTVLEDQWGVSDFNHKRSMTINLVDFRRSLDSRRLLDLRGWILKPDDNCLSQTEKLLVASVM
ncbi:unnamed protein product [Leuciscus chuanchicus]